jgi:hypothetical protein
MDVDAERGGFGLMLRRLCLEVGMSQEELGRARSSQCREYQRSRTRSKLNELLATGRLLCEEEAIREAAALR